VIPLKIKIPSKNMHENPTNNQLFIQFINYVWHLLHVSALHFHLQGAWRSQIVTKHNTPIHHILWTAPQLSIFWEALGTLSEDGNVMPKHVGAAIYK
jgi:hypothetical protein